MSIIVGMVLLQLAIPFTIPPLVSFTAQVPVDVKPYMLAFTEYCPSLLLKPYVVESLSSYVNPFTALPVKLHTWFAKHDVSACFTRQPLNVYPVFVGIVVGGVNVPSYTQLCDADGTVNSSSPLYQCNAIVFACQPACKFDVPEYVSNVALSQSALVAPDDTPVANNGAEIKIEKIAKQIVPICFILSNRLHVCVCVCVCV